MMIKAWEGAMASMKPTEIYTLPSMIMATNCVAGLKMLLDKGADINKGVTDGTLLHVFASSGNSKEARKAGFAAGKSNMEAFGLKVPEWYSNLGDDRNGTPDEMLKLLLAKGLNINEKNKGSNGIPPSTPLEVSLGGGLLNKPEVTVALVNNGADVKVESEWYGPAIIQAAQLGSVDVLKAMLDKGANINATGKAFTDTDNGAQIKNHTPLTAAAMKNHTEAVKFLLDKGANTTGISGSIISGSCPAKLSDKSAIYFAIENKNIDMIKYIAEHNGYNGKELSISAKKMTNCVGGGSYSPSEYAKALDLGDIKDYLKKQNM
jgi:ankyrin repeat protein